MAGDGSTWDSIAGGTEGAKALRVTLPSAIKFRPGDTLSLDFTASVPLSAPRDGSVANNSVAYRLERAGYTAGLETGAGGVQVPAAASDYELSGHMIDGHGDGISGGVELQLFKLDDDGKAVDTGERSVPATSGAERGVWGFIGLDDQTTYLVKPVATSDAFTVDAGQLDADGFLKYTHNGAESTTVNDPYDVADLDGKAKFPLGDAQGYTTHWVKDLLVKVSVKTAVSGDLVFVDKDGNIVADADDYINEWKIALTKSGESGTVASTTTGTDGKGSFTMKDLDIAAGDYKVTFTAPNGVTLPYASVQVPGFDSGVYEQKNMVPGTGIEGLRVRVTDNVAPVITSDPVVDKAWNPTEVSLAATDADTKVTGFNWSITGPNGYSRTGTSKSGTIALPTLPADGEYDFKVVAVDFANNFSDEKSVKLNVDTTAPTLTAEKTEVEYVKGSPAAPTDDAGWIALFGVKAEDATSGVKNITVDSSAVKEGAGTFTVKFTATDNAGNTSEVLETTYKVSYVGEPTVTVGKTTEVFEMKNTDGTFASLDDAALLALFGVTSAPAHVTAPVTSTVVDASAVQWDKLGTYDVKFSVVDSLGTSSEVTTVKLTVQDTVAPTLTLSPEEVDFVKGDTQIVADDKDAWIALFGAAASDDGSGVAPEGIVVDASAVDYGTAGTYAVVFTVTDVAGNKTEETGRYTVKYAGDPEIEFTKDTTYVHELGDDAAASTNDEWVALFGAEAKTAPGTTLKSLTADATAVDWSAEGDYKVTFVATDSNDNTFETFATVTVKDTTKPVVTLNEPERKHAMVEPETPWTGADWADFFGAEATDGKGTGVDASSWQYTGSVNWLVPGTYEVELTVSDKANTPNVSDVVVGKITIQAPPTEASETARIAQEAEQELDPQALSVTTGSFIDLADDAVSAPDQGGTAVVKNGKVVYTPKAGFYGDETFTVTVTDDLGQTAKITYVFTVVQAPGLVDGKTISFDTVVDQPITIADAVNLPEVRGENLSLVEVKAPADFKGTVLVDGDDIVFTTDEDGWSGEQQFIFVVKDDVDQVTEIPVTVTVAAVNMSAAEKEGYAGEATFEVEISNMVPGGAYELELHSSPLPLTKVAADADGKATVEVTIPAKAKAGEHRIVLLNSDERERASVDYTVLVKPDDGGKKDDKGGLSNTGADTAMVVTAVGAGLALLLLGAVVLIARRRSQQES